LFLLNRVTFYGTQCCLARSVRKIKRTAQFRSAVFTFWRGFLR